MHTNLFSIFSLSFLGRSRFLNFSGQPYLRKLHFIHSSPTAEMNISDQIQDARAGSAAAQKALFDHLADPMMAVCCRYLKSREDAEEVLLDGFYKFFSHLREFRYQGEAALFA